MKINNNNKSKSHTVLNVLSLLLKLLILKVGGGGRPLTKKGNVKYGV